MSEQKIIMFSGKFCAPCKVAKPYMDDFCEKNNINLDYRLVENCDERELDEFDIEAVPTLFLYKNDIQLRLLGWNNNVIEQLHKFYNNEINV